MHTYDPAKHYTSPPLDLGGFTADSWTAQSIAQGENRSPWYYAGVRRAFEVGAQNRFAEGHDAFEIPAGCVSRYDCEEYRFGVADSAALFHRLILGGR